MRRLTVDYTRYLRSPVVEVAVFASERVGLHVGETVLVNGEDRDSGEACDCHQH